MRKRSGIELALSTSVCATGGWPVPRADWATNDSAMTEARARLSRAVSSSMSRTSLKPHSGASRASADWTSTRGLPERITSGHGSAGGRPGFKFSSAGGPQAWLQMPVDEESPDLLERDDANELLDVHAAVAERAAGLIRLGNLGRECDYAFEAGLNLSIRLTHVPESTWGTSATG